MNIIMILLLVFMVYMTINNFKQLNANKNQKKYIESYRKMLNEDEDSYEFINSYINEEENPLFKSKAYVVLAGEELKKENIDACKKALDEVNFSLMFYKKDSYNFNEYIANSDTFLWLIYIELLAHKLNKLEVIDYTIDKLKDFDSVLSENVEYTVFKSLGVALTKGMNENTKIFKLLLDGEYSNYKYDKRVIGLYKRISAMMLLYKKEEVEQEWIEDQSSFSNTMIGKAYLKALGVYEKYHKEEEKTEEESEVKEIETTAESNETEVVDKNEEITTENKADVEVVEKEETTAEEVVENKEESETKNED